MIAHNRENAVAKLKTLPNYCNLNYIIPQISKSKFIVVNGIQSAGTLFPFGASILDNVGHLEILGSHLSFTGILQDDLELHMKKRYVSCIKFYNFCRENRLAPLSVKIKVLKACVMGSLLYNCETLGNKVPKELETVYHKLIRCAFQVRSNTHVLLLYVECGLLPLKALIESRRFKFYQRLPTITQFSARHLAFDKLREDPTSNFQHYVELGDKYSSHREIYKFHLS